MKIMENPIKMDDLGVPLFSETSMSCVFPMSHICSLSTVTVVAFLHAFGVSVSETATLFQKGILFEKRKGGW